MPIAVFKLTGGPGCPSGWPGADVPEADVREGARVSGLRAVVAVTAGGGIGRIWAPAGAGTCAGAAAGGRGAAPRGPPLWALAAASSELVAGRDLRRR